MSIPVLIGTVVWIGSMIEVDRVILEGRRMSRIVCEGLVGIGTVNAIRGIVLSL